MGPLLVYESYDDSHMRFSHYVYWVGLKRSSDNILWNLIWKCSKMDVFQQKMNRRQFKSTTNSIAVRANWSNGRRYTPLKNCVNILQKKSFSFKF